MFTDFHCNGIYNLGKVHIFLNLELESPVLGFGHPGLSVFSVLIPRPRYIPSPQQEAQAHGRVGHTPGSHPGPGE